MMLLREAVSKRLNWKLYILVGPQTGELPYRPGWPESAFSHGLNVIGSNTLNIIPYPQTLVIESVFPL